MYGGKQHTLRNAFSSDLGLPKSKFFQSAPTMVGPVLATKFLFSRALTLIAIALAKFGSPAKTQT